MDLLIAEGLPLFHTDRDVVPRKGSWSRVGLFQGSVSQCTASCSCIHSCDDSLFAAPSEQVLKDTNTKWGIPGVLSPRIFFLLSYLCKQAKNAAKRKIASDASDLAGSPTITTLNSAEK